MVSQRLLLAIAVAVSGGTHVAAGDLLGIPGLGHCSTCVRNHTLVPVYVPMPMAPVYSYGSSRTVVRQVPGRPPEPVPKWARPYGTVPVIAIQEPAPKWAGIDPSALAVNSLRHPGAVAQPLPAAVQMVPGQQQPQAVRSTTVPAYVQLQQGQPVARQSMAVAQPVAVQAQAGHPPTAAAARPGIAVPVAVPGAPIAVAPGLPPAVGRQQVAAPRMTAGAPVNPPAPVAPQTRQVKLFDDDTSKPPPGTLGRTYMRPTRMVPWDTHPRVGMLDVEILDSMRQGLAHDVKI